MNDMNTDDGWIKSKQETIDRYLVAKDIGSFIMMDAALAMQSAKNGWARDRRPVVGAFERKWIKVYAKVNSAVAEIGLKGKEWELTHWMGFAPEDVKELLKLREEWDNLDWPNTPKERREFLRDLWAGDCLSKDHLVPWQPYFDRRAKKPLSETHDWDHFSGLTDKAKIMLGSSAGRVLLTVQDRYKNKEPESIFNGAWITLIFDGTSKNPRGGLQGLCASRDEALGLLQVAIDHMPKLVEDHEVFIA